MQTKEELEKANDPWARETKEEMMEFLRNDVLLIPPSKPDPDWPQVQLTREQFQTFIRFVSDRVGLSWTKEIANFFDVWARERYGMDVFGWEEIQDMVTHLSFSPLKHTRIARRVTVLGGGAYGTAMAVTLARRGHSVMILMRVEEQAHVDAINLKHVNPLCFPKLQLPFNVRATTNPSVALGEKDVSNMELDFIVHAIPVQFTFGYLRSIKDMIPPHVPLICISKGIASDSLQFSHDLLPAALGRDQPCAFLAGPSFAKGIIEGNPTAVTVASNIQGLARAVQVLYSNINFRVFTTDDVIGVEVGGALKNVLAIACGVCKGLGLGPNTQTALVTRGWADIRSIAKRLGARDDTLQGLSGLGDLMLTCFGGLSRNARFGQLLASEGNIELAKQRAGGVVEGYPTAFAMVKLAHKMQMRVPVIMAIAQMLAGNLPPKDLVSFIMALPLSPEDDPTSANVYKRASKL